MAKEFEGKTIFITGAGKAPLLVEGGEIANGDQGGEDFETPPVRPSA